MNTTTEQPHHSVVVLWTEDDENDRMMIQLALSRSERPIRVVFVEDGDQAWAYLRGRGEYADRERYPLPDALVTDLKMPRCNGFELVARVRGDVEFGSLPIYIFSASDLLCDRQAAQQVGVDGYVTKPTGFGLWTATVLDVLQRAAERARAA